METSSFSTILHSVMRSSTWYPVPKFNEQNFLKIGEVMIKMATIAYTEPSESRHSLYHDIKELEDLTFREDFTIAMIRNDKEDILRVLYNNFGVRECNLYKNFGLIMYNHLSTKSLVDLCLMCDSPRCIEFLLESGEPINCTRERELSPRAYCRKSMSHSELILQRFQKDRICTGIQEMFDEKATGMIPELVKLSVEYVSFQLD